MKRAILFFGLLSLFLITLLVGCEQAMDNDVQEADHSEVLGVWAFDSTQNALSNLKYWVLKDSNEFDMLYQTYYDFRTANTSYYLLESGMIVYNGYVYKYELQDSSNTLLVYDNPADYMRFFRKRITVDRSTWIKQLYIVQEFPITNPYISRANQMASDGDNLWILYYVTGAPGSSLLKLSTDGDSLGVLDRYIGWSITYGDGALWTGHDGFIWKLDPSTGDTLGPRIRTQDTPTHAYTLAYDNGTLWTNSGGALTQFDASTGEMLKTSDIYYVADLEAHNGVLMGSYSGDLVVLDPDSVRFSQTIEMQGEYLGGFAWDGTYYYALARDYTTGDGTRLLVLAEDS